MFSDELKKVNKDIDQKEQQKELERKRKLEVAPEKIIEIIKYEAKQKVEKKEFKSHNGKNRVIIEIWTGEGLDYERTFISNHVYAGYYVLVYPGTMEKVKKLASVEGIQIIEWGLSCRNDMIRKRYNTKAIAKDGYKYNPLLWIKCAINF